MKRKLFVIFAISALLCVLFLLAACTPTTTPPPPSSVENGSLSPSSCEHEEVIEPAVEASCYLPGKTEGVHCKKCGEILVAQHVLSPQHHWVDGACVDCKTPYFSEGLAYRLETDGYYVTGIGSCTDQDLVIPAEHKGRAVVGIAKSAFSYKTNLRSVTFPDSLVVIEDSAFHFSTNIKKITFGKGLKKLGYQVFWMDQIESVYISDLVSWCAIECDTTCTMQFYGECSLYLNGEPVTNLVIPEGVSYIRPRAFSGFTNIKNVTLPESMQELGENAFTQCASLEQINLPDSITKINSNAFSGCQSLKKISLPSKITYLSMGVLSGCTALETVTIPENVNRIEQQAFLGCTSLKNVVFNDKVTSIGKEVFRQCTSLEHFTVPNSVSGIGFGAFSECTSIKSLTIPFVGAKKIGYSEYDYLCYLFGGDVNVFNRYKLPESLKVVSITDTTKIASQAFIRSKYIEQVILCEKIQTIGEKAFEDCLNLTDIWLEHKELPAEWIESNAFGNCTATIHLGDTWEYVDGVPTKK